MREWAQLAACGLLIAAACSSAKKPRPSPNETATVTTAPVVRDHSKALAIIERFECARCHDGTGAAEVVSNKHCVRCHQEIQRGTYEGDAALVAKWSANIHSLPVAPSLDSLGVKLRRSWVREQLLYPRDVRPALEATMPRLALSQEEAELVAAYLVPQERSEQRFPELAVQRGAALFRTYNCDACHAFGERQAIPRTILAAGAAQEPTRDALLLAPDLLLTRERFQSGALVPWLLNPQALQPGTLMPNFNLKESEAASLAAFIWHAKGKAPEKPALGPRLALLDREVRWEEVFTTVIKTVCWHCHSSKEFALGDGGPGNTGGFGYPARGLDMSSYEAIQSGSFGPDGRRRSIFSKDEEGVPLLIRSMLAREEEERGHQGETLGMPLGFPAMTREQIQLVESWIAQGRPR